METKWPLSTLGEHIELSTGEAFKSAEFTTNPSLGTRLARGDNVKEGAFEWGEKSRYWPSLTKDLEKHLLKEDDILLGMDGSKVGKNWVRVRKGDLPCLLVQRVARLRAKQSLDQIYLGYLIGNEYFRNYVEQIKTGSAIPHISGGQIKAYQIPLPPLAEQKRIAGILGSLDDKIELNRKMNETLEQMIKALFKSWFVDFDPVHAKAAGSKPAGTDKATDDLFPDSFVDSELGKIPKGWRIGTISEIATNPKRGIQPGDIAPGTPYIGLEHMPRRSIALGDWADSSVVESGKNVFKKGEILFGKLRPYFHKVGLAQVDGVCSTDILVLSPISEGWRGSLLCIASSDELIQFTNLASTGTKMPRTNWGDVGSFKIVIPCNEVAKEFTEWTTSLTDKIGQNLAESKALTETRDVLLSKLLSRG